MIKNALISYISLFVTALLPLFSMPLLAEMLGSEAWGIFSFAVLLQIMSGMLDQGLSQSIMSDITKYRFKSKRINSIISYIRLKYKKIAIYSATTLLCFSMFFIKQEKMFFSIIYASFVIFFQLNSSVYRSILLAFEDHKSIAKINIAVQFFRYAIPVFLYKGIDLHFDFKLLILWFLLSFIFDFLVKRYIAHSYVNFNEKNDIHADHASNLIFKKGWWMSVSVAIGAAAVYIDRFSVSIFMSKSDLGIYTIASTLALGVIQIANPLGQLFFPKIIKFVNKKEELIKINYFLFFLISSIYVIGFLIYYLFGEFFLNIWLNSYPYKNTIDSILFYMLLGCFFNSLFNIFYWNLMARGASEIILRVFILSSLLGLVFSFFLVSNYGILGASLVWVVFNAACLLSGLFYFWKFR